MRQRKTRSTCGSSVSKKVDQYIKAWERCGYPDGIPDEVPDELMRLGLAPSYKAICFALLKNDMALQSLGFTPPQSKFYHVLKKLEIEGRSK